MTQRCCPMAGLQSGLPPVHVRPKPGSHQNGKPMNARQQQFVAEYLKDLNATQAAIRAGYSAKTAYSIGQENLRKPAIAEAVQAALEERRERTLVTADEVVTGLKDIAVDGENQASARVSAWGLLGKHLGMFRERVEHTGADGGPIEVVDRSASLEDVAALLKDAGALK